jgi:hypothetical protein
VQLFPLRSHTDPIRLRFHHIALKSFGNLFYFPVGEPEEMIIFRDFNSTGMGAPCYYTLSYTWGAPYHGLPLEWDDPNETRNIYIDDQEFPVRWNLAEALRSLCQLFREPRMFWIDAICIDQSNLEERSTQVQLMHRIYYFAVRTYAWLGPTTEDSGMALQAIADYNKAWSARKEELRPGHVDKSYVDQYKALAEKEIRAPGSIQLLRAIAKFFLRNWWSRAWIVQEAVLSKRLQIICGSSPPVEWESVSGTFRLLSQHMVMGMLLGSANDPLGDLLYATITIAHRFQHINEAIEMRRSGLPYHGLPEVLFSLRTAQSLDPRDKVYAGLSISRDPAMVTVNYQLSFSDVFLLASKGWIEKERDLHILDFCVLSQHSTLPSWVTDWTNTTKRLPLPKRRVPGIKKQIYSAGGYNENLRFRFANDNDAALILQGIPLDTISFVGEVAYDQEVHWTRTLAPKTLDQAIDLVRRQRDETKKASDAINSQSWLYSWLKEIDISRCPGLRTKNEITNLEGPSIPDDLKYAHTGEDIFNAFMRTCLADVFRNETGSSALRTREYTQSDDILRLINTTLLSTLPGRTFIATSQGFIGLAPEEAQPGDWVCVIPGNETPVVLRYQGDKTCIFVGECYLHGIMDGQYLNLARRSSEIKDFQIKAFVIV